MLSQDLFSNKDIEYVSESGLMIVYESEIDKLQTESYTVKVYVPAERFE